MPEELLERLQQLEDSYYGDKEEARRRSFLDTYGARFSGNRGLGLAILNELDAQGIDTSAADEAVTAILDKLRIECNEILDALKDVQRTAIDNAKKVESIQSVVSDAVASNAESTGDPTEEPDSVPMVPTDPTLAAADAAGEAPEIDEPPMPEGEEPLPPDQLPPPVEEPDPNAEVSDARAKRIKRMKSYWSGRKDRGTTVSDARAKRIKSIRARTNKKDYYTPSAGVIAAVTSGGY